MSQNISFVVALFKVSHKLFAPFHTQMNSSMLTIKCIY